MSPIRILLASLVFVCVPVFVHAETVIFLTTVGEGTWTVPNDWNNANNPIEVIGSSGEIETIS